MKWHFGNFAIFDNFCLSFSEKLLIKKHLIIEINNSKGIKFLPKTLIF